MQTLETIISNILWTILLKIPKWIRMRFDAEKWVGKYFKIKSKVEKFEAEKKEHWRALPNYPFNRVWVRIPWDNRSQCDVELKELFLRVFVNHAPLKYIIWKKRELEARIEISEPFEKEFDVYGAEKTEKSIVFPKNSEGGFDVYTHLPTYIDIESDIYIEILGMQSSTRRLANLLKK